MSPTSTYTWPSPLISATISSSVHNSNDHSHNNNSSSTSNKFQHTLHITSASCLTAADLLNKTDLKPNSTSSRLIVADMKYDGLWSLIVTVVDSAYTDT